MFAEVYTSYVYLRANLSTDFIDAVDCATRRVAHYFVGTTLNGATKTVSVGAVLAQKAFGV